MAGEHTEQVHESANKRKHEGDQMTDHKDKKIHVEERKPCIEDLHQDVGKIYQICRTRKTFPSIISFKAVASMRTAAVR